MDNLPLPPTFPTYRPFPVPVTGDVMGPNALDIRVSTSSITGQLGLLAIIGISLVLMMRRR